MSATNGTTNGRYHEVREQLRIAKAERQLAQVQFEKRLAESFGYNSGWGTIIDPRDRDSDMEFSRDAWPGSGSRHHQDGGNRPFIFSQTDMQIGWDRARWLVAENDHARGALLTLRNFTIRKGFKYEVKPEAGKDKDPVALELSRQVQACIDRFSDLNKWAQRERSAFVRSRRDGEVFLRHFAQSNGDTLARFVEVEQVLPPNGEAGDPAWSWGCLNKPGDIENIEAYGVDYYGTGTADWQEVPAEEMSHLKLNVDECVKRGLSDFYFSAKAFQQLTFLLECMRVGSSAQAAIPYIEKFTGASTAAVAALVAARRDQAQANGNIDGRTGRAVNATRIVPGKVPLIGEGRDVVPAPANPNASAHNETVAVNLRSLACRWSMPEYMISGDACLSEDSQILTARGWVGVKDLRQDDLVGTVNPDTHALEYQLPLKRFCTERTGTMIHVQTKRFDLLMTPNHDAYVSRLFFNNREEWKKVRADELLKWPYQSMRLLSSVQWKEGESPKSIWIPGLGEIDSDIGLRFIGLYAGDGSISSSTNRVSIGGISKPRKLRFYAPILEELGFNLCVDSQGRSHWYADNRELHDWLAENMGTECATKRLPKLVWSLGVKALDLVWDGLLNSDGHRQKNKDSMSYSTISRRLADDVQILLLRRGKRAAVSVCPPGQLGTQNVFKVHVSEPKPAQAIRTCVKEVQYKGLVWCVQVPNGLIVSRRNGKVAVSGNSNANLASLLVSGSPLVNSVECEQDDYAIFFLRSKWIAVRNAAAAGRFVVNGHVFTIEEIEAIVDIHVTPPQVAIGDELKDSQIDMADIQQKVISPQERARRRGVDPEVMAQEIEAWNKRFPQQQPQPGGAPGGSPFGNGPAGMGDDAVSRKIKLLMDEGKPQDQAIAIAMSMQKRGELSGPAGKCDGKPCEHCGDEHGPEGMCGDEVESAKPKPTPESRESLFPAADAFDARLIELRERYGSNTANLIAESARKLLGKADSQPITVNVSPPAVTVTMPAPATPIVESTTAEVPMVEVEEVERDPRTGLGVRTRRWKEPVELTEAGIPNKTGPGCHDPKTGHPASCSTGAGDKPEKQSAGELSQVVQKKPIGKVRTKEPQPSDKAARAKASHKLVNKDIQRYAEEYNEPRLAKVLGGVSHPDSEPMDVTAKNGDLIEMKTMVDNSNNKITMDSYSQIRKIVKEKETGKTFHTVVSDDSKIYNAGGEGKHDESKGRTYYYRRGVAGSARIDSMYKCKDEAELKKLLSMPDDQLPAAAQRTDAKHRVGSWKFFEDDQGKGYKNTDTGVVFRAKK